MKSRVCGITKVKLLLQMAGAGVCVFWGGYKPVETVLMSVVFHAEDL